MYVAERLAAFAYNLGLAELPDSVQDAAAIYLADTLACALAATREPDAPAVDTVVSHAARSRQIPEATVIGRHWKTNLQSAALANCTLARYCDANDIYMPEAGSLGGAGHFSDAIPALLAIAESTRVRGQDLIQAIIIAYECQAVLADMLPWLDVGLHSVSQVSVAVALAGGKMLGLTVSQLEHAAALAITTGLIADTWLHPAVDVPTIKGGAPGMAAERGVTCAQLAGMGFTAPPDAFETVFRRYPEARDLHLYAARLGNDWKTARNAIKPAPAQIYTQAVIQCARQMYRQGLRLERLDRLAVRSNSGACARVQGSPGAFRPASREAADHSTPFVAAMALLDGNVTPSTYYAAPWLEERVLASMARIELFVDAGWEELMTASGMFGAQTVAVDSGGNEYSARVEQFRGHPDNPMSRKELIEKLSSFVGPEMDGAKLLELCENLIDSTTVDQVVEFWCADSPEQGSPPISSV